MAIQILSAVGSFEIVGAVAGGTDAAGDGGSIVIEGVLMITVAVLNISTSGGTKGVQFGGQLGLGLDERSAVVPHRLVAGIGVLGHDRIDGGNQDKDEQD